MSDQGGLFCFGFFISLLVSYLIGLAKNDVIRGLVWGLLLGPIGWAIVICLPSRPDEDDDEMIDSPKAKEERERTAREKAPSKKYSDDELCYLCGKPLQSNEMAGRVCFPCRV